MAITYVTGSGAITGSGGASSLTLAVSTASPGDFLVAAIAIRSDPTLTAPSGWTQLIELDHTGVSLDAHQYYRAITASGSAAYTWSWSGSTWAAGVIANFRGADTVSPWAASAAQQNTSSTSCTAPTVTAGSSSDWLIFGGFASQTVTSTPPTGMTEIDDRATTGGTNAHVSMAYQALSASGATGTRVATLSSNPNNIGINSILRAAGGGGGGSGPLYYVDTVSGSNGNAGTLAEPWGTVAYAVAQLAPGNTLYIRGGSAAGARRVITEQIDVSVAAGCESGTSGSRITVTNYPGEYVEFRPSTGGNHNWRLIDMDYWTFTCEVLGTDRAIVINRNDLYGFAFTIEGGCTYCTLERWAIYGGSYDTMVRITNSSNNTIQYCRIYDNERGPGLDAHGVYIHSSGGSQSNDNLVYDNDIYNVAGHCVEIENAQSTYELRNIIRGNRLYAEVAWLDRSEAPVADKNGDGTIIEDNVIYGSRYHVGAVGGTSNNGRVVVQANQSINGTIRRNILRDFSGRAIVARPGAVITHNRIYDFVYESAIDERWAIYVENSGSCAIYHNTIVGAHPTGGGLIRVLGTVAAVNIRNNIFYDTGNINIASGPSMTWGYNCWYSADSIQSGTGDVLSNPLFTNTAANDYTLQPSSQCINAGTVIAGINDGYVGGAPDIGYWEYEPATSGSPGAGESATSVNTSVFGRLVLVIR